MTSRKILHPAPFSDEILDKIEAEKLLPEVGVVIDCFAGVGCCHRLATETRKIIGIEIEPEWAAAHPDTRVGDATKLPFGAHAFDAALTSPAYGNRYADSFHKGPLNKWRYRSYAHDLRETCGNPDRELHRNNTGGFHGTSSKYWELHGRAWRELARVLKPGAPFVLNVSDYMKDGKRVNIVDTHAALLTLDIGFELVDRFDIPTKRMRYGANAHLRVEAEAILVFEAPR